MSDLVLDIARATSQIKQGKPCVSLTIKKYVFKESGLHHIVDDNNMIFHLESLDEYWDVLYIYEDPQMEGIIKSAPNIPKTKYDHWVLGNLFGYSHESIMRFISKFEE